MLPACFEARRASAVQIADYKGRLAPQHDEIV